MSGDIIPLKCNTTEFGFLEIKYPLYIGVDGGGTGCRASLFDANLQVLGRGHAGPANIARNFDAAIASIEEAAEQAITSANLPSPPEKSAITLCAGLAGHGVSVAQARLSNWQHPYANVNVTNDVVTALYGAFNGDDGAALIVGTGSCAASIVNGKVEVWGGHGLILGDKGSGAWIGQQALRHVLRQLDKVSSYDEAFCQAILNSSQTSSVDAIVDQFCNASPGEFGALAPTVYSLAQQQNPVATAIVQQGADYLSQLANKALAHSRGKICLFGGLSRSVQPFLVVSVTKQVVESENDAEKGAVLWYLQSQG